MSGYAWYNVFGIPVAVGTDESMYTTVAGDFGAVAWKNATTLTLEKIPDHLGDILSAQFVAVIQLKADRIPIARTVMESNTRFAWDGVAKELTISGGVFLEGQDCYNVVLAGKPRAGAVATQGEPLVDEEDGTKGTTDEFAFDLRDAGYSTFTLYFPTLTGASVTVSAVAGYVPAVDPDDPDVPVYAPATVAYYDRVAIAAPGFYVMDVAQDAPKVKVLVEYTADDNEVVCHLIRGSR